MSAKNNILCRVMSQVGESAERDRHNYHRGDALRRGYVEKGETMAKPNRPSLSELS